MGAVAIDNLMEDAATAEISRSQVWQWIKQPVVTEQGDLITHSLVERMRQTELAGAKRSRDDRFDDAAAIVRRVTLEGDFPTFLTIPAYTHYLVDTAAARVPVAA